MYVSERREKNNDQETTFDKFLKSEIGKDFKKEDEKKIIQQNVNYLFRQKKGVNKISTVKSSKRPISIKKQAHHCAKGGNAA